MRLLDQVGSFVPAASARMHVFDAVFTRMGASDNLAMGRSTFLEVCARAHCPFQSSQAHGHKFQGVAHGMQPDGAMLSCVLLS